MVEDAPQTHSGFTFCHANLAQWAAINYLYDLEAKLRNEEDFVRAVSPAFIGFSCAIKLEIPDIEHLSIILVKSLLTQEVWIGGCGSRITLPWVFHAKLTVNSSSLTELILHCPESVKEKVNGCEEWKKSVRESRWLIWLSPFDEAGYIGQLVFHPSILWRYGGFGALYRKRDCLWSGTFLFW